VYGRKSRRSKEAKREGEEKPRNTELPRQVIKSLTQRERSQDKKRAIKRRVERSLKPPRLTKREQKGKQSIRSRQKMGRRPERTKSKPQSDRGVKGGGSLVSLPESGGGRRIKGWGEGKKGKQKHPAAVGILRDCRTCLRSSATVTPRAKRKRRLGEERREIQGVTPCNLATRTVWLEPGNCSCLAEHCGIGGTGEPAGEQGKGKLLPSRKTHYTTHRRDKARATLNKHQQLKL